MAQQVKLDQEKLICSICLELQKDPVIIPCGHTYCTSCIKACWEQDQRCYSCPQCRQSFAERPVLVRNITLGELVEDAKKAELQPASHKKSYAEQGDVLCDFCDGKNRKASMSCLMCVASYCEHHLQPHYNIAPLKKHKLIKATSKLQDNICSCHDEVLKIFCRTDQKCICYLCSMDDHKGHDMVSVAAQRAEKQEELKLDRQKVQKKMLELDNNVKVLQQEADDTNVSADKAVLESENIVKDLISFMRQNSCEVETKIRSRQVEKVRRIKKLQEGIQQEITGLRQTDGELEQVLSLEDHLQFLGKYTSLPFPSESADQCWTDPTKLLFDDLLKSLAEFKEKMEKTVKTKMTELLDTVDVLLPEEEPRTREDFMKYYRQITLDPNTAYTKISLTKQNREATLAKVELDYPSDPDRFVERWQVLAAEGLTGRCYWEVEWSGDVYIAAAYKDIGREGLFKDCGLGKNKKSWVLECSAARCHFRHDDKSVSVTAPLFPKVGVYLDHGAGSLSFYSISETLILLHKVQTKFTQPLYPGFWLPKASGGTLTLCDRV